ncbi:hypothetical protein [Colwellia piezophila]|uniref:hypothetical protein n=1 Tax=Colwellia piezophila TaxID=211668 RepID=UPI00035E9C31|nr:hypothetical protein [Colwellia piezophila]
MKYLIFVAAFILSGCNATPNPNPNSQAKPTDIVQLIEKTKRRYPEPVRGTFQIPIKASGFINGVVYLNSDVDYRDPKNITVVLLPSTVESFAKAYHSPADAFFIDKTIQVTGKVVRVRKYLYINNKRTRKYYYQTHIHVSSLEQVKLLSSAKLSKVKPS